jgi:hypothetical protein
MKRDEFFKLYGDEIKKEAEEILFADKVREIIFVKFIYSKMLNMHRTLPEGYKIKMGEIWSNSVKRDLEKIFNISVEELLQKSQLAQEIIKRGYEVEVGINVVEQRAVNGEIHGWRVYATFEYPVEAMYVAYGEKYKRKVGIFVQDGMFLLRFPPFNLKDNSPTGFLGVECKDRTIIVTK